MGSVLAEKYIQFTARGLDLAGAHLDQIKEKFGAAAVAADRMNKYLSGGVVGINRASGQALDDYRKKMEMTANAARKMNADLASSMWVKMSREVKELTERNKELAGVLASGAYAKHAREMAAIAREYERLKRVGRLQELVLEYGKLSGAVKNMQEKYADVSKAASVALAVMSAAVMGLVYAGLQGTVEGERLTLSWQLLSREVASVFKPVIDDFSEALTEVVQWFQSLSGEGQAFVRALVLVTGGFLGLIVVVRIGMVVFVQVGIVLNAMGLKFSMLSGAIGVLRSAFFSLYSALGVFGTIAVAISGLIALFGVFSSLSGPKMDSATVSQYLDENKAARLRALQDRQKFEFTSKDERNVKLADYSGIGALQSPKTASDKRLAELKKNLDEQKALMREAERELERQAKGGSPKDRKDVTLAQTAREGFADTYDRLSEALLKVDAAGLLPEEKTAENTAMLAETAAQILQFMMSMKGDNSPPLK